jgi:hypothetical protein
VRHALIERDRVQPVFQDGLDPHEAPPLREQCAQIPRRGIGHPDSRESIVPQQVEEVPSVPLIGLRLADDHGADLGGIADDHGVPEAVHEGVEPDRVAGAFNAHGHGTGPAGVELLDGAALVEQLPLLGFARLGVECRNLLLARVEITANECHEGGLLSEGVVPVPQPEPTYSGRPFS